MTKVFAAVFFLFFQGMVLGQVVPLRPENWAFRPGTVEFVPAASGSGGAAAGPSMKIISRNGVVTLKNTDFTDGTIEFDDQPTDRSFASFYFHWQDSLENECFYFRTQLAGHPDDPAGVQYAPTVKGINCWNIMGHYQGNATFQQEAPNHVKLVISGRQMRVFVNSQERPTLEIPRLEGNTTHGTLGFDGQAIISNLVIRPGRVEGLSPVEGPDPTSNDPRYIRHWQVTQPDSIPRGIDFSNDLMPGKQTIWMPVVAERRGLVNLTRLYGASPSRRIVWLKTTLHSDGVRKCQLRLGFLDEVWIWINGHYLYLDKNFYGQPIAKDPRGRLSIENTTLVLPLQQGDNELLIGVGNNFYGWGIAARLDDLDGIGLEK
jgi:hypothetical protein